MPHPSVPDSEVLDRNSFLQVALLLTEALERRFCSDVEGLKMLERLHRALDGLVRMNPIALDENRSPWTTSPPFSVAPDEVIENAAMLAKSFSPRGVQIELRMGASDALISIPAIHLQQVLFNLIRNALETAPTEGGTVVVASSVQRQGGRNPARMAQQALRITITDNGSDVIGQTITRGVEEGVRCTLQPQWVGVMHARRIAAQYGASVTLYSSPVLGTRAIILWPI